MAIPSRDSTELDSYGLPDVARVENEPVILRVVRVVTVGVARADERTVERAYNLSYPVRLHSGNRRLDGDGEKG